MIALEAAKLLAARDGLCQYRRTDNEIKGWAVNIERSMRRSREELFLPWNPEMGKGIHRFATPTKAISFGTFMFMGRPLPKPIGLDPRVVAKSGRPKTQKG